MTYDLCGDCLHAKSSHTQIGDMYHCACCNKLCEKIQYHTEHKASGYVVQDGYAIKVGGLRK